VIRSRDTSTMSPIPASSAVPSAQKAETPADQEVPFPQRTLAEQALDLCACSGGRWSSALRDPSEMLDAIVDSASSIAAAGMRARRSASWAGSPPPRFSSHAEAHRGGSP